MPVIITPDYDIYDLLKTLVAKVDAMSQTLSQQIDAITAALKADMDDITAKLDTIIAGMQPGSMVTQAQVDALAAVKAGFDAVQQKVDAAAAPPPPAP